MTAHRAVMTGILDRGLAATPDRVAVRTLTEEVTYRELAERTGRIAALLADAGVARADRVGVASQNSLVLLELMVACVRSGITFVPFNWRFTARELAEVARASAAKLIFADAPRRELLATADIPVRPLDDLAGEAARFEPAPTAADVAPDDAIWHLFTSGTASLPKQAVTSHRNLASHLAGWADAWGVDSGTVYWNPYPSFHNTFTGANALILAMGGRIELRSAADMGDFIASVRDQGVTLALMVPTVLRSLLAEPAFREIDATSLRRVICGTAPTAPDLMREFARVLPGCVLSHSYGMTETTTPITHIDFRPDDIGTPVVGSVGAPLPWYEVQIRALDGSGSVEPGGSGEIWLRSETIVDRYENGPPTRDGSGWFRTADVGRQDAQGRLHLSDRIGDLIISGGENISPAEVEKVVAAFPGVSEVAVVGRPDERWGEVPVAFVVAASDVDMRRLADHARANLATFKVPRGFVRVDSLPRGGTGKVLRRELRAAAADSTRKGC